MKIYINGKEKKIVSSYLSLLLEELGYAEENVATAYNEKFISKENRSKIKLEENCRIEVLSAQQGG
tara:strand:+ start:455 stop:652 length:198 start_codon:yes stop_codon:yes gene_type:complete